MQTNNILWSCPECGNLNKWTERICRNCPFDFDKELAKVVVTENHNFVAIRDVIEDIRRGRIPIETTDGRFYFRRVTNPTTKQRSWWHYVAMLGRATSGKHMPMNVVMKKYKSLKEEGFSQGEILSIMGG